MWKKQALAAAFAAASLTGCGGSEVEPVSAPELAQHGHEARVQRATFKPVALDKLPGRVHRYAAQLLEDVRDTESAPTWKDAVLASAATPMFRPDVLGVAYYEFRVLVAQKPMGFIIVSIGAHDFPVAHWAFEGESLTAQLLRQSDGKVVTGFYKLDALSYAAEGEDGQLLATLGELPPRIEGHKLEWLDKPVEPTSAHWIPSSQTQSDKEASALTGELKVEGPTKPAPIKFGEWTSWEDLKKGYGPSYAVMAESLRRQAAEEWDTDARALESGEGLVLKRPYELALLHPEVTFKLTGEGEPFVRARLVETSGSGRMLVLTAVDAKPGEELPVEVSLQYGDGRTEQLRFVVLSPQDVGVEASAEESPEVEDKDRVYWAEKGEKGPWSSWDTRWAGGNVDQRWYQQIDRGTAPNSSRCVSGCGGTAWAMLFGWGDYQAGMGNPAWSHRFGLYRPNGGLVGNEVAPSVMTAGVRNMTWEIRNHIGTFCISGSGATFPWAMSGASSYLSRRTGASLSTHYNMLGIHEAGLRDRARDSIRNRKVPAIIGTGWLKHYPLAYGYRSRQRTVRKCFIFCWNTTEYQREFYVNQGWGAGQHGWVSASTWFAGHLYAN